MVSVLLIPLVFHPATSNSIIAKDYLAIWFALFFLVAGGTVLWIGGGWRDIPKTVWIPLAVYLSYGTLRALMSPYPEYSWNSWRLTLCTFSPILACFLVVQRRVAARRLAIAVAFSLYIVVLYGILQFFAGITGIEVLDPVKWPWHLVPFVVEFIHFLETDFRNFAWETFAGFSNLPGVCSTLGNPNFLAGFLVPLLPFFAALCFLRGSPFPLSFRKTLPFLAMCLVVCGLFLAGSRGGFLGVLGALIVAAAFLGREKARSGDKRWLVAGAGVSLAAFLLVPTSLVLLFSQAGKPEVEKGLGAVENRSIVYRYTGKMIRDHLLFGVTPGNFTIQFPDYLYGPDAEKYGWMESPEEKVLEHAHSEILEIWAELGLVGLAAYLFFLGGWFAWVWRGWKWIPDAASRWILVGLVSGAGGALFQNLISVNLRWTSSVWLFWGFVGAAAGWVTRFKPRSNQVGQSAQGLAEDGERIPPRGPWVVPVTALAVVFLFLPSAKRLSGDFYFVSGRNAATHNDPKTELILQRSVAFNPSFPQTHYLLGGCYYSKGDYKKAIEHYERVRQLRGNVVVLTENMATAYVKLSTVLEKDFERTEALLSAIDLYEDSLRRHPSFPRLEDYLARAYQLLGFERLATSHRQRAIELYEKWLAWESSYPRPQYALDLAKNYFMVKEYEKAMWLLRRAKRWEGPADKIDSLKKVLFQKDPSLEALWEREERKEAETLRESGSQSP